MKSVLISIQPKWCELIASGKKTVEVRKTRPKLDVPFKVYIYETKAYDTLFGNGKPKKLCVGGGKVIGEFVCNHITRIEVLKSGLFTGGNPNGHCVSVVESSMLSAVEIKDYANNKANVYGWHISDLVIYDKPKELSHFLQYCEYDYDIDKCIGCKKTSYNDLGQECCDRRITRPPQSWCYVEGGGSDA